MVVFAQTSKKIEQSAVPAFPTFISHRFYAIWKHLRKSIPRNEANDQLILKFFQASEIPSDVKVFTDAAGPWPTTSGERAFMVQNHPELNQAIDYCVANGVHLIIPSLGDYSWYRRAAMSVLYELMLHRKLSFTVLDDPICCSSDHPALLEDAVMKFRRKSEVIFAARQEMHRELHLTGKYKTKHGDGHLITRQPGGAIRGLYTKRKQNSDAEIIPVIDSVAGQAQGFSHLTELLHARGVRTILGGTFKGSQMEFLMRRCTRDRAPVDEPPANVSCDATPQKPQVVYKWNLTNAINARISNSEAFARKVMPHIIAAANGASSLKEIARRLNEKGVETIKSKQWTNVTVSLVIERGAIIGIEESAQLLSKFITHPGQSIYSPRQKKTDER